MENGIRVTVLEPGTFKDKDIIVKLNEHISEDELLRLQELLRGTFPGAQNILVLGSCVDIELPPGDNPFEAVPLEHFLS